jgi:hypothetical protein
MSLRKKVSRTVYFSLVVVIRVELRCLYMGQNFVQFAPLMSQGSHGRGFGRYSGFAGINMVPVESSRY